MKRFFDAELENLLSELLLMGDKAIAQIQLAMKALDEGDNSLADQVIQQDDEIDQLELKIDDNAIGYMSLRAPVASQLRVVIVAMKASHDLERIGDEVTAISRRIRKLVSEPPLQISIGIQDMAQIAMEMLREALDCLLQGSEERAIMVVKRDAEVDQLNRSVHESLSAYMAQHPETISRAIGLMFISKSLERIADHATNIAEETVFLSQAKDIRHSSEVRRPAAQG